MLESMSTRKQACQTLDARLLMALDAWCAANGTSERVLGSATLGDPDLVASLRRGRSPRLVTADGLLAFIGDPVPHDELRQVFRSHELVGEFADDDQCVLEPYSVIPECRTGDPAKVVQNDIDDGCIGKAGAEYHQCSVRRGKAPFHGVPNLTNVAGESQST